MQRDRHEPEQDYDGYSPEPDLGEREMVATLDDRRKRQDRCDSGEGGPLLGCDLRAPPAP